LVVAALGGAVVLYIMVAFILGVIPVNKGHVQAPYGAEIYITSNGVHLDIIMPVATAEMDWRKFIHPGDFPGTVSLDHYIGFGWGERNFYINTPTWSDLRFDVAVAAMLWPTPSAMHVNYYQSRPRPDPHTVTVTLDDRELGVLLEYIFSSFQTKNGRVIVIEGAGYDVDDNFYEARGKYHMFFTSNDWVNAAMKKTGVRSAVWSPFDKALLYQLRKTKNK
jgi:uncharacterized protein (TIGR02117 family)